MWPIRQPMRLPKGFGVFKHTFDITKPGWRKNTPWYKNTKCEKGLKTKKVQNV